MKAEFRPATRDEIAEFYPGFDKGSRTLKAWVGLLDGEVAGLAGFAYQGGAVSAFMDFKTDEARRAKVSIVKAARTVMQEAKAAGYRHVFADANPDEPGAPRFLESLGFERSSPFLQTYVWKLQ